MEEEIDASRISGFNDCLDHLHEGSDRTVVDYYADLVDVASLEGRLEASEGGREDGLERWNGRKWMDYFDLYVRFPLPL